MKLRTGFVSNSSSASFAVPRVYVSEEQLEHIRDHIKYAAEQWPSDFDNDASDEWTICEGADVIEGFTDMDNFDMLAFLGYLGIHEGLVRYVQD